MARRRRGPAPPLDARVPRARRRPRGRPLPEARGGRGLARGHREPAGLLPARRLGPQLRRLLQVPRRDDVRPARVRTAAALLPARLHRRRPRPHPRDRRRHERDPARQFVRHAPRAGPPIPLVARIEAALEAFPDRGAPHDRAHGARDLRAPRGPRRTDARPARAPRPVRPCWSAPGSRTWATRRSPSPRTATCGRAARRCSAWTGAPTTPRSRPASSGATGRSSWPAAAPSATSGRRRPRSGDAPRRPAGRPYGPTSPDRPLHDPRGHGRGAPPTTGRAAPDRARPGRREPRERPRAVGVEALLAPDMAFLLGSVPAPPPTQDVLWLLRADQESTRVTPRAHARPLAGRDAGRLAAPARRAPPSAPALAGEEPRPPRRRRAASPRRDRPLGRRGGDRPLRDGPRPVASARVVATDRLHGSIFGMLLGRPVVALPDRHGKLRSFHRTWTRDCPDVTRCDTVDEARAAVAARLSRPADGTERAGPGARRDAPGAGRASGHRPASLRRRGLRLRGVVGPHPRRERPDALERRLHGGPAVPVHVVRVRVHGPLERLLAVEEEHAVELLLDLGRRVVEEEQVGVLRPVGRLGEDPVRVQRLHHLHGLRQQVGRLRGPPGRRRRGAPARRSTCGTSRTSGASSRARA